MVYEELFLFQLKIQAYRALSRSRKDGIVHTWRVRRFVSLYGAFLLNLQLAKTSGAGNFEGYAAALLYEPVAAGRCRFRENRNCGYRLYGAVKSGVQGALMVPTEILAEQHMRSLQKLFEPYSIVLAFLPAA